jgi:hypothetical protein
VTTSARRRMTSHESPSWLAVRRTRVNGTPAVVDLAERHSQDLDVFLMWGKQTGRLWVRVTHRSSGRTARIEASASNALDVFNHPFAYAQGAR